MLHYPYHPTCKTVLHISGVAHCVEFLVILIKDTKIFRPDPFFTGHSYVVLFASNFQIY